MINLPYFYANRKTNKYGIIDDRDCDVDEYAMCYGRMPFITERSDTTATTTRKKRRGFTKQERLFILEQKGQVCSMCSTELDLQIHHIDSDASNNELINLELLCYRCHKITHRKKTKLIH